MRHPGREKARQRGGGGASAPLARALAPPTSWSTVAGSRESRVLVRTRRQGRQQRSAFLSLSTAVRRLRVREWRTERWSACGSEWRYRGGGTARTRRPRRRRGGRRATAWPPPRRWTKWHATSCGAIWWRPAATRRSRRLRRRWTGGRSRRRATRPPPPPSLRLLASTWTRGW